MSSPKRQLVCTTSHDGTTSVEPEPRPPPHIPVDLLLEIFARPDVATVVRCAATSKAVRRAIMGDPTIGRRVAANNGAHLLGVSYAITERDNLGDIDTGDRVSFVVIGQAPRHNHHLGQFNAGRKLRCSEPVASRGGLIVLRERRSDPGFLFVWNTVTRLILFVPLTTEYAATVGGLPNALVTDALLAVGDAGRSFQLLVVTSSLTLPSPSLRTQMYSKSKEDESGRWGPVTVITDDLPLELKLAWARTRYVPRRLTWTRTRYVPRRRLEALVLGGGTGTAVHWLQNDSGRGRCIIRLDIHEARATSIALPRECAHQWVGDGELQLAASTDGKLSLVVAERCGVISMWTLLSAATAPGDGGPTVRWTRQVVIRMEAIGRVPIPPTGRCKDMFLGFGELSSTVVLLVHHVGRLVRINLRTKEALVLGSDDEFKETQASHGCGLRTIEACLHEIDLPSLLLVMKPY